MIRWAVTSLVPTLGGQAEPITLDTAKVHCRVVLPDEDEWFTDQITAARRVVERRTARQLMPATVTATADGFSWTGWVELPKPPLRAVTSVSYLDSAGASQVWPTTQYQVQASGETARRGRIALGYGLSWPVVYGVPNAVTAVYTAGYADAAAVPADLKLAMLLLIGHWWMNREAVGEVGRGIEFGFERLIADYISREY